ncbi:MAG: TonB family protein, partial [Bdellovibrionaceae bacterium]|nr:TonB family protein [Pseudobdellovibrionaceae bacterium]
MPITERASREERVPGSLSESRIRARTFACVSISVLAHMSLLIGMILAPQKFKEIAGGNQKPEGAGIAMLDGANTVGVAQADKTANTDTVEVAVAPQATLTDSSSDVVIKELPRTEPLVAVKPVVSEEKPVQKAVTPSIAKPVAKAAKPAVQTAKIVEEPVAAPVENAQADVMTDESQEAPPVLLATPPSDDNSSDEKEVPAQAAAAEQEQPVAIAPTPIQEQEEAKAEQVQPMAVAPTPESNSETSAETAATAQSASAGRQEAQQQARSESPAPIAGRGGSGSTEENSAGAGGRENNAGLGPAIGEPVRNASELKVLPGNAQPAYPQRDRLARKQGTSVLVGKVTSDGRLVNTKVERSSGSALMDSASLQAF